VAHPKKKRKDASTSSVNGTSLKCLKRSSKRQGVYPFGGSRDLSVRFAMIHMKRIRKAVIRIAHPNPTEIMRRRSMMGKMTPPSEDPEAVTPRANARRRWNQLYQKISLRKRRVLEARKDLR
jgi:hypothetical protein